MMNHDQKMADFITETVIEVQSKHYRETGMLPARIEIDVQIMGPVAPYKLFAEPVYQAKKCPCCGSVVRDKEKPE